ncbi:MAG TPA: LysR substrate-binding domain-containing protein [Dongiaceae bacterium]|nr:LysR substrate-binding domain-containing protein [Dongiaceae bacterium]
MSRPIRGFGALPSFAAAARHKSFTAAANDLGVTQAAISHQIRELEDQLEVKLFHRSSRAVALTPAGEILRKAVDEAFEGISHAIDRMKSAKPRLRVTSPPSFAAKWLVPRLDRFLARAPEVDVFFDIQNSPGLLSQQEPHVAIQFGAASLPNYQVDRLQDEYVFPICSPALLREKKRPLDPRALLKKHTLLDVDWHGQGASWPNWQSWLEAAGLADIRLGKTVRFAASALAIQAAVEGQGIALGESTLAADDLAAGRLVKPFDLALKQPPQLAYFIICPKNAPAGSIERLFRDWLLEEARLLTRPAPRRTRRRSKT